MFELSDEVLRGLFAANEFTFEEDEMLFVGIRGCLPLDGSVWSKSCRLERAVLDYQRPRCTLTQWLPGEQRIAVYPGSTVPHRRSILAAKRKSGIGANQLMPGFYRDYEKGWHRANTPTGHFAWRQTGARPIRRTADDLDYETSDRVELANPLDNIHAAWCNSLDQHYSSAGCQVVMGLPKCKRRGSASATGPWREFQERGYATNQGKFGYALFDVAEALRAAVGKAQLRVKFGSIGVRSRVVQEALQAREIYMGELDGQFGVKSMRALLAFQKTHFGAGGTDGIVGPQTARALGLSWE